MSLCDEWWPPFCVAIFQRVALLLIGGFGEVQLYCNLMSANVWRASQLVELQPLRTTVIEWSPVPPEVAFVIIEAHAQFTRLLLASSVLGPTTGDFVNETNAALALTNLVLGAVAYVTTPHDSENITTLIVVFGYTNTAPMPGGCNMEFEPEVAPYVRLSYNRVQTTVEFQRASVGSQTLASLGNSMSVMLSSIPKCDLAFSVLEYDVYFMVIRDSTLDPKNYFRAVATMSDVTSIRRNGIKVSALALHPATRVLFTSFPGVGVVYNVIVRDSRDGVNTEAAYAPAVTYSCDPEQDDCYLVVHTFGWLFCILCGAVGTFLCLAGHRYFLFEMFCFGFLAAALATFFLLSIYTNLDYYGRTVFTMVIGVVGGGVWASIWWFFGSPIISVLLPGLVLGFLFSCIVFFTPLINLEVFQDELVFWMTFLCFLLLPSLIFVAYPKTLSIVSCAVVGSYGAVIAADRYLGSNMIAIVLDIIKRGVVPHVADMTTVTSFQKNDVTLTVFWALGTVLGIISQLILIRNRPPFPATPYLENRRYVALTEPASEPTERTPLLAT